MVHPPRVPPATAPRVTVVHLPPAALDALAAGDLAAASAVSPVPLPPAVGAPDLRWLWRLRSEQVRADPAAAAWVTGVLRADDLGLVVGHAGFHGPPDEHGTVEVGYAVDPEHRRRGHARAALGALLRRAAEEPDVRTVRATVSPDNVASRALVDSCGFVAVGEQWDEVDGLEVVLERAV